MNVYQDDSDEFDPDYLAYLVTLTNQLADAKVRLTRNSKGELVRFEAWVNNNVYYNFPLSGWMEI